MDKPALHSYRQKSLQASLPSYANQDSRVHEHFEDPQWCSHPRPPNLWEDTVWQPHCLSQDRVETNRIVDIAAVPLFLHKRRNSSVKEISGQANTEQDWFQSRQQMSWPTPKEVRLKPGQSLHSPAAFWGYPPIPVMRQSFRGFPAPHCIYRSGSRCRSQNVGNMLYPVQPFSQRSHCCFGLQTSQRVDAAVGMLSRASGSRTDYMSDGPRKNSLVKDVQVYTTAVRDPTRPKSRYDSQIHIADQTGTTLETRNMAHVQSRDTRVISPHKDGASSHGDPTLGKLPVVDIDPKEINSRQRSSVALSTALMGEVSGSGSASSVTPVCTKLKYFGTVDSEDLMIDTSPRYCCQSGGSQSETQDNLDKLRGNVTKRTSARSSLDGDPITELQALHVGEYDVQLRPSFLNHPVKKRRLSKEDVVRSWSLIVQGLPEPDMGEGLLGDYHEFAKRNPEMFPTERKRLPREETQVMDHRILLDGGEFGNFKQECSLASRPDFKGVSRGKMPRTEFSESIDMLSAVLGKEVRYPAEGFNSSQESDVSFGSFGDKSRDAISDTDIETYENSNCMPGLAGRSLIDHREKPEEESSQVLQRLHNLAIVSGERSQGTSEGKDGWLQKNLIPTIRRARCLRRSRSGPQQRKVPTLDSTGSKAKGSDVIQRGQDKKVSQMQPHSALLRSRSLRNRKILDSALLDSTKITLKTDSNPCLSETKRKRKLSETDPIDIAKQKEPEKTPNGTIRRKDAKEKPKNEKNVQMYCATCEKRFPTSHKYQSHEAQCQKKQSTKKTLSSAAGFRSHNRRVHLWKKGQLSQRKVCHKITKTSCFECKRSYKTLLGLKAHILRVHDNFNQYCCKCDRAFRSPQGQKLHATRIHSQKGEKDVYFENNFSTLQLPEKQTQNEKQGKCGRNKEKELGESKVEPKMKRGWKKNRSCGQTTELIKMTQGTDEVQNSEAGDEKRGKFGESKEKKLPESKVEPKKKRGRKKNRSSGQSTELIKMTKGTDEVQNSEAGDEKRGKFGESKEKVLPEGKVEPKKKRGRKKNRSSGQSTELIKMTKGTDEVQNTEAGDEKRGKFGGRKEKVLPEGKGEQKKELSQKKNRGSGPSTELIEVTQGTDEVQNSEAGENKKFLCFCGKRFIDIRELESHLEEHQNTEMLSSGSLSKTAKVLIDAPQKDKNIFDLFTAFCPERMYQAPSMDEARDFDHVDGNTVHLANVEPPLVKSDQIQNCDLKVLSAQMRRDVVDVNCQSRASPNIFNYLSQEIHGNLLQAISKEMGKETRSLAASSGARMDPSLSSQTRKPRGVPNVGTDQLLETSERNEPNSAVEEMIPEDVTLGEAQNKLPVAQINNSVQDNTRKEITAHRKSRKRVTFSDIVTQMSDVKKKKGNVKTKYKKKALKKTPEPRPKRKLVQEKQRSDKVPLRKNVKRTSSTVKNFTKEKCTHRSVKEQETVTTKHILQSNQPKAEFRIVKGIAGSKAKVPKKWLQCGYCQEFRCLHKAEFTNHIRTSHKNKCCKCKLSFATSGEAHRHRAKHYQHHYCATCGRWCVGPRGYLYHVAGNAHRRMELAQHQAITAVCQALQLENAPLLEVNHATRTAHHGKSALPCLPAETSMQSTESNRNNRAEEMAESAVEQSSQEGVVHPSAVIKQFLANLTATARTIPQQLVQGHLLTQRDHFTDQNQQHLTDQGQIADDTQQHLMHQGQIADDTQQHLTHQDQIADDTQQHLTHQGQIADDTQQHLTHQGQIADDTQQHLTHQGQIADYSQQQLMHQGQFTDQNQQQLMHQGQVTGQFHRVEGDPNITVGARLHQRAGQPQVGACPAGTQTFFVISVQEGAEAGDACQEYTMPGGQGTEEQGTRDAFKQPDMPLDFNKMLTDLEADGGSASPRGQLDNPGLLTGLDVLNNDSGAVAGPLLQWLLDEDPPNSEPVTRQTITGVSGGQTVDFQLELNTILEDINRTMQAECMAAGINVSQLPTLATDQSGLPTSATNQSQLPTSATNQSGLPTPATNQSQLPTLATNQSGLPTSATNHSGLPTSATNQSGLPTSATNQSGLPTSATNQSQLPTSATNQSGLPTSATNHSGLPTSATNQSGLPTSATNQSGLPTSATNQSGLPTPVADLTRSPPPSQAADDSRTPADARHTTPGLWSPGTGQLVAGSSGHGRACSQPLHEPTAVRMDVGSRVLRSQHT